MSRLHRNERLGGHIEGRRAVVSDEEHRNMIATLRIEDKGESLSVSSVLLNKGKNGKAHFTLLYEIDDLVVRRGMPFSIAIKFDRNIDVSKDIIILQLTVGARPQESKGTLLRLKLNLKNYGDTTASPLTKWSAVVNSLRSAGRFILDLKIGMA